MFKNLFTIRFLVHALIAIVVVVGVIAAAYFYLESYTRQEDIVEVPDLSGYDVFEANALLKELTLEGMVVDSLYLPTMRGGVIVEQEPIATATVKENRKIYLTIARYSSPMVKLPNIEDQTLPLALAKLNSYGIKVGELIYRPSECTDCVIGVLVGAKQIEPGTGLSKGQIVDLIVGEGATGVEISTPIVYGLSVAEAQQLLNREGLNLGATVYLDSEDALDSAAARVFRQAPDPSRSSMIKVGSSIDVYLTPDLSQLPAVNLDSIKARLQ